MNSLIPGRRGSKFKSVISEYMSRVKLMSIPCDIILSWLPENNFDENSAWVHVISLMWMTWNTSDDKSTRV